MILTLVIYHPPLVMANFQPPEVLDTVLNLTTANGRLSTPPVTQSTQENLVVLKMFSINILMENLSFSTPPFETWRPVECQRGFLSFPQHQSLLAPLPDHQQPMAELQYRHQPPYQHNNPGRARPATSFHVPPLPHQYRRNGSWTNQNSSWDTVPFNPNDPHLSNLPFPRQQPKVNGPSVTYHGPSKEEFLESFRQSQRKMREAEHQYMSTALQDIASSRTASENGSTSSQPDQQSNIVQADVHAADRDQNQITSGVNVLDLDNNHTGENDTFQTPSTRPDAVVQTSRPRLSGKRLANTFSAPRNEEDGITRADHDLSMDDDLRVLPLAASQLRGVQQPMQPLRETVPSALTQSQPAATASVPVSVGQISSAMTVQTPQSVQQVHYSPASAAAVTTESASAQPKITAKPTADQLIIQTRRQKQDAADKALQENNALTSLLKEANENGKTKNDFKMGDKIPEFLLTYSSTLVSRANSHQPPDELAENLFPYLLWCLRLEPL